VDPKRNTGGPGPKGARASYGGGSAGAQPGGIGGIGGIGRLGGIGGVGAGSAGSPGAAARRPAAAPAARSVNLQEALDQLGRNIQQLRIEFERFFSGGVAVPPEELRNRIAMQLRQFRSLNLTAAVDSFRLSDLEARFNPYNELFNRRLREREEGRQPGRATAEIELPSRYDVAAGILVADSIEPAAAEALYVGLSKGGGEAPRFDLGSFQTYIERQAAAIRARTGCNQVQFRLADEDGKLKLKARPIS
jgi:hypothetical protein